MFHRYLLLIAVLTTASHSIAKAEESAATMGNCTDPNTKSSFILKKQHDLGTIQYIDKDLNVARFEKASLYNTQGQGKLKGNKFLAFHAVTYKGSCTDGVLCKLFNKRHDLYVYLNQTHPTRSTFQFDDQKPQWLDCSKKQDLTSLLGGTKDTDAQSSSASSDTVALKDGITQDASNNDQELQPLAVAPGAQTL